MPLPLPGTPQLDGPPPSPTPMGGINGNQPFSMQGLAPQIPFNRLPPEILTGITQAAQTIAELLDSFAQVTPDKGAQLALLKDLLQQYLADLMVGGAGATDPTATGRSYVGGGMDRGIAGPQTL